MRRLLPPPATELDEAQVRSAYAFPDRRPWVRGSMVASLDGAMRGPDGTSRSIASAADRAMFPRLRASADVILVGAGTIRDEDYHPSRTPIAVVTASLRLPADLRLFRLATDQTARPLVITSRAAAAGAPGWLTDAADLVPAGEQSVDLSQAIRALAQRGLGAIHCEGGPRLLGDLAQAGLLDELLLTLTPALHGVADDDRIVTAAGGLHPAPRLPIRQLLIEDGSVFLRAVREPLAS